MGIRRHGRYINEDALDGPDPGQNTIAFCNLVAAEQMRMLVRYTIGEDWWHDGTSTAGRWAFEHRFVEVEVEAETEPFEHPGCCVVSCEFSHLRLGLGEGGRPGYPFADEPQDSWAIRMRYRYRQLRMRFGRAKSELRT